MKKILDNYFDCVGKLNAEDELKKQYKRMDKDEADVDWEKVYDGDILYISSKFDCLEWWKSQGSTMFPEMSVVVLPILALPALNAFLERIFSTCTFYDDPLRQRLSEERFEKGVLLGVNADFRKEDDKVQDS